MGEDSLGVDTCAVSALLDVNCAVIERNGYDGSKLVSPDAVEVVFGPDVGILQREPVPMHGRLGGAPGLLQER